MPFWTTEPTKLYVTLEGDLAGASADAIDAEFTTRSMRLSVRGFTEMHCLRVDSLMHRIVPAKSKAKVSSKGEKVIVTLRKENSYDGWGRLRGAG